MNRVSWALLALLVFFRTSAQAQDSPKPQITSACTLTLAQAPAIRGLKLGMTAQELLRQFPGSTEGPKLEGWIKESEGYPHYGVATWGPDTSSFDKSKFEGVQSISVTLFDGRAVEIRVFYEFFPRGPRWRKVDDFIAKLSKSFALPAAADWTISGETGSILSCKGFEIEASIASGPANGVVMLRGPAYKDIVRQRQEADEEKLREEFKP